MRGDGCKAKGSCLRMLKSISHPGHDAVKKKKNNYMLAFTWVQLIKTP